jgi:hypothetical protein
MLSFFVYNFESTRQAMEIHAFNGQSPTQRINTFTLVNIMLENPKLTKSVSQFENHPFK